MSGLRGASALRWTVLGMFPTVLPVAVTLGAMGYLSIPLDAGTAMVGAVIVGIAVDDAIHLIGAYRVARNQDRSPLAAMRAALARTGQALVTSSIALSVSLMTSS